MTIDMRSEMKPRELVPEGNHVGRLYSIIEIGRVPNTFPGAETPTVRQIRLSWELPDLMREFDGEQKPLVIGAKYTASMGDKANLRRVVEGMVGAMDKDTLDSFDIKSLLGKECLVNVVHKTSRAEVEYAAVVSCSPVPAGLKVKAQFNDSVYLDYAEGWDDSIYAALPQFIKDEMEQSDEMKRRDDKTPEINPNDIPF